MSTVSTGESRAAAAPTGAGSSRLVFNASMCRACRVCETVCSIGREGLSWPAVARIRIRFDEFDSNGEVPISAAYCRQCDDAPCIEACRVEAMSRDPETGVVLIDEEVCVGCKRCLKACPYGAIVMHPEREVALKCDLCREREQGPLCVAFCPLPGAALRVETAAAREEAL